MDLSARGRSILLLASEAYTSEQPAHVSRTVQHADDPNAQLLRDVINDIAPHNNVSQVRANVFTRFADEWLSHKHEELFKAPQQPISRERIVGGYVIRSLWASRLME